MKRKLLDAWFVIVLLSFCDWLIKRYVFEYHQLSEFEILPGLIGFKYVENYGMVLGYFQGSVMVRYISLLVNWFLFVFFSYCLIYKRINQFFVWGYVLILAGTIGNAIDRLFYGYVIDYLEICQFAVMNLADFLLLVALLLISIDWVKNFGLRSESDVEKQ